MHERQKFEAWAASRNKELKFSQVTRSGKRQYELALIEFVWEAWQEASRTYAGIDEEPSKLRPFASADEFEPYRERWIHKYAHKIQRRVVAYDDIGIVLSDDVNLSYQELLDACRFEDGSFCGIDQESST